MGEITIRCVVGEITMALDQVGGITKDSNMVGEITKTEETEGTGAFGDRSPLLPDRHPTGDLFVCDILDAAPKGDMASMEHPIFSLSTKADTRIRRYQNGPAWVEITPSVKGLATVHDRDVLIYCISQVMAALNDGKRVTQTLRLKAFDLLTATNRVTDGRGYAGLRAALERLRGTTIVTNVTTAGTEELDGFGLIENFKIVRETRDGRMQDVEIKLSDWVFKAIRAKEVLTLHRDYFRLRKPLERRMYELARKHCGQKTHWSISLELLQKKCGSHSTTKEFKRLVGTIIHQNELYDHFPDYVPSLIDDLVHFRRRESMPTTRPPIIETRDGGEAPPTVRPETLEAAKKSAPRYDIYQLYAEWQAFCLDSGAVIQNPDGAFIGFCRKRHERAPLA